MRTLPRPFLRAALTKEPRTERFCSFQIKEDPLSFLVPKQKWVLKGHESHVARVFLTPDGRTIISMGENGYLRITDAETGSLRYLDRFSMDPRALCLSPDGTILAMGFNGELQLFSLISETLECIKSAEEHWSTTRYLTFSPDGKDIVFVGDSRHVYQWKEKEKQVIRFAEGHRGSYSSAPLFFPDGHRLISCPHHDTMKIYGWETRKKITDVPGFIGVRATAISPDGTRIAVVLHDETYSIGIYDPEIWIGEGVLCSHTDIVYQAAFSPNGKYLATGSQDHTLIIWEVSSGKILRHFEGFKQPIQSFCFSADWSRLVVCTHDSSKVSDENAISVMDFDGPNLGEVSKETEYFLRVNKL